VQVPRHARAIEQHSGNGAPEDERVIVFVRWCVLLALVVPWLASAQTLTAAGGIQGRLSESTTYRPIADAEIQLLRGAVVQKSTRSDASGAFVFTDVPEGVYQLTIQHPGYLKAVQPEVRVVLRRISAVDLVLTRGRDETLAEVVVSAPAMSADPEFAPNNVQLDREEIRRIPGSGGDIFRALDILPGVVATGEFSNFTVRGNGPRDNLIIVDGIPFDKVVHFDQSLGEQEEIDGGGRYSIFAPNVIGNARFSPGGWRASEGGKNGSLLELELAEPNEFSSTVGARIDIVGAEVDYEGPTYVADDTSVLLSARSFDFSNLFEAIDEPHIGDAKLADVILKSVTQWNEEHRFELLGHTQHRRVHAHGGECAAIAGLRGRGLAIRRARQLVARVHMGMVAGRFRSCAQCGFLSQQRDARQGRRSVSGFGWGRSDAGEHAGA
jgi:Carboxypeptidase regulatory-like domain/TonB-dependent Receptor Plug Domain